MESRKDAQFRLKLSEGFIKEAEEDLKLGRWRSCVKNFQLAVENTAKAVKALFMPVPKFHKLSQEKKKF